MLNFKIKENIYNLHFNFSWIQNHNYKNIMIKIIKLKLLNKLNILMEVLELHYGVLIKNILNIKYFTLIINKQQFIRLYSI